jgi:hypothetical protein
VISTLLTKYRASVSPGPRRPVTSRLSPRRVTSPHPQSVSAGLALGLLLAQNVPARVVMEILGHSQIALTMNTYSHVAPEVSREAADRMARMLWQSAEDDRAEGPGDDERVAGTGGLASVGRYAAGVASAAPVVIRSGAVQCHGFLRTASPQSPQMSGKAMAPVAALSRALV